MATVAGLRIGGIMQEFQGNLPGRLDGYFLRADVGRRLHFTVLVQHPVKHAVTQQTVDLRMLPESLQQEESLLTHGGQFLGGFRRLDLREVSRRLLAEIPVHHFRLQDGIEFGMLLLEIDQKPVHTFSQQPQAAQTMHVGLDVHRIQPLLACVYLKDPGQLFENLMKQDRV